MSDSVPACKVRALIPELIRIWCDELTNNERRCYEVSAGRGVSGLLEFLKTALNDLIDWSSETDGYLDT